MQLKGISPGDIIIANVKGRRFLATVVANPEGTRKLEIKPINQGVTYHEVTSNGVEAWYKRMGRKSGTKPVASPPTSIKTNPLIDRLKQKSAA